MFVAFAALPLASCGGGVGGTGISAPPQPPLPNTQEPDSPTVNYTGNAQPAMVDKSTAEYWAAQAVGLRSLVQLAESLWIELPPFRGAVDETIAGTGGGTANITGTINTFNVGWLEVDFQSYSENGTIFNGRSIQRYRDRGTLPPDGGQFYSEAGTGTVEFDDLSISIGSEVVTV